MLNSTFQTNDIAPASGGVWGFEVVLDGVGEDVGLAFAVFLGVLLAADDDGLGAVAFVDAVYHLVELPELLDVFGIEVKEILLQRAVGGDAEDDDSSPLVEVALVVDAFQHLLRRLHDVDGGTAWRDKPLFLVSPALGQVFAEGIGGEEHPDDGSHRALLSEFLGTAAGIVRHVGIQRVEVGNHPVEIATGADAFLLRQFLIRHHILAVEFLPGAQDIDVVEGHPHPVLVVDGEVVGGAASEGLQLGGIPSADAPDILHGEPFQGGNAVRVVVDDGNVAVEVFHFSTFPL